MATSQQQGASSHNHLAVSSTSQEKSSSSTSSPPGTPPKHGRHSRRARGRKVAKKEKLQRRELANQKLSPSGDCSVSSTSTMGSLDLGPSTAKLGGSVDASVPTLSQGRIASETTLDKMPLEVVQKAWANEEHLLDDALNEVLRRTGVSSLDTTLSTLATTIATATAAHTSEDEDDEFCRHRAVSHLQKLLDKWIPRSPAGDKKRPPANPWNRTRPTLITFGSYRLGVHRTDSDMDVLALCPPEFSRGEFFSSWVDLLKNDKSITKVHAISSAYTPVIKFMFESRIHVDMLFARVANATKLRTFQETRPPLSVMASVPQTRLNQPRIEYKIDDSDLKEQDEAGVRSLNGARVSQMLLEMVPDLTKFRKVLRAVKEWAVAKGIYSNVLGFLGGVNFAILVAYICRKYPKEDAPTLLFQFFRVFSEWSWPEPVTLVPIESVPPEGAPFMPAWDPQRYPRDGMHVMPIITPAYPSMNSTYNVGRPQLRRMQVELKRAADMLLSTTSPIPPSIRQQHGSNAERNDNPFSLLFEKSDFFARHANFLEVKVEASNSSEQDFLEWFRLIESRLRLLIANLETQDTQAWPYSHFIDRSHEADDTTAAPSDTVADLNSAQLRTFESSLFIGLRFAPGVENLSLAPLTSDFVHKINAWPGKKPGMNLRLSHFVADKLPVYCRPPRGFSAKREQESMLEYHYASQLPGLQKENLGTNRYTKQGATGRGHYGRKTNSSHNYQKADHPRKHQLHGQQSRQQWSGYKNSGSNNNRRTQKGIYSKPSQDPVETTDVDQMSSSSSSSERAETEETQSMASDASFATDTSGSVEGASSEHKNKGSPVKRICVYKTTSPASDCNPGRK